jgi:hypothetical protein
MGFSIEHHVFEDGLLYVFALDREAKKHTVVYTKDDDVYRLKCIMLPTNEWGADPFQNAIESRDESKKYLVELGENVDNGCLTYNQFIPREHWESVEGVDHELIENTKLDIEDEIEEKLNDSE